MVAYAGPWLDLKPILQSGNAHLHTSGTAKACHWDCSSEQVVRTWDVAGQGWIVLTAFLAFHYLLTIEKVKLHS